MNALCAALDRKLKLPPSAKLVLCDLIRHCDGAGKCYPSVSCIAEETCLSRSTVKRALRTLEATGVVAVSRQWGATSHYRVHCEPRFIVNRPVDPNFDRESLSEKQTGSTGFMVNRGWVHGEPGGGVMVNPKLIIRTVQELTNKGARDARVAVSFATFIRKNRINPDALRAIRYFVRKYREERERPHPPLRPETWREVAESILLVEDEECGRTFDVTHEEFKAMVRRYFAKKYDPACDYSIAHFNSNGVKVRVYYETLRRGCDA